MGSQTQSNNRFIFRQHVQRITIQKISSIEMAATKMKHILVLFVILALTKNLGRQFASAKSVRNVVEEESPSMSSFLEEDLLKMVAHVFLVLLNAAQEFVLPLFVLETKI